MILMQGLTRYNTSRNKLIEKKIENINTNPRASGLKRQVDEFSVKMIAYIEHKL